MTKDALFNEDNIPESNWFKFTKVGDRVSGEVVEVSLKESQDEMYPSQRVFVLKQENGELVNVGVKVTSGYLMSRTSSVVTGDTVGFEFKKEIPAKQKGYNPAKSIEVYVQHADKPVDALEAF